MHVTLSLKLKAGRSEAQGDPQLPSELASSLELCMKGRRKEGGEIHSATDLLISPAFLVLSWN